MALYATNEFLTISLMPSAVADIGGQRFYAWVTTVYLVASVVVATTVQSTLMRFGPRWSYLLGLSVFGIGSLACAASGWRTSPPLRPAFSAWVWPSAGPSVRSPVPHCATVAPVVMAAGLGLGALTQYDDASAAVVAAWAIALLITGAGVGIAWPHLSAWAMSGVDDPAEGPAAAAAINTVQLISGAIGAGLAGVVVNILEGGDLAPARWLFTIFAMLAAVGTVASIRSGRRE